MRSVISNPRVNPGNLTIALVTLLACVGIVLFTAWQKPSPQEGQPGWQCYSHGNKVCGDPSGERATTAWETWDRMEGWRKLKADPTKEVRVDYVGTATVSPRVEVNEVALPASDGLWYVFRASQN